MAEVSKDKHDKKTWIPFQRTGNFWLDNGLIGMFHILRDLSGEVERERYGLSAFKYEFDDTGNAISVEAENDEILVKLMNVAREKAIGQLTTSTKNFNIIYVEKNDEFKIANKNDWLPAYKSIYKGLIGKGKKAALDDELLQRLVVFKEAHPEVKNNKDVWLNAQPQYEVGKPFDLTIIEKGKNHCAFSNKNWKKIEDVKGYNFPFLTAKKGALNFFSHFEKLVKISSLYSFVSIFAPLNMFYSIRFDGLLCYFIAYDIDLEELAIWLGSLRSIRNLNETKTSNFKRPMITRKEGEPFGLPTTYLNESLLIFLYSIYTYAYAEMQRDFSKEVATKSIISFVSDGNIFQQTQVFTKLEPLFEFLQKVRDFEMEKWGKAGAFEGMFNNFSDPQNRDTPWKDWLAKHILDFTGISRLVEEFLGDVAMRDGRAHFFLAFFTEIYTKEMQTMNANTVDLCKKLGNQIGRRCYELQDKGILYSLRNARNRTVFLKVLSDAQFKLEIGIPEQFFHDLPDTPEWEEMKSLVTIFGMNSFLYHGQKQGGQQNG